MPVKVGTVATQVFSLALPSSHEKFVATRKRPLPSATAFSWVFPGLSNLIHRFRDFFQNMAGVNSLPFRQGIGIGVAPLLLQTRTGQWDVLLKPNFAIPATALRQSKEKVPVRNFRTGTVNRLVNGNKVKQAFLSTTFPIKI
ncbi:hypothetical protein [Desulfonatronum parangueonense]